jgi:hypothetical protein
MKLQVRILVFGAVVEGLALGAYFMLPHLCRVTQKIPWHEELWYSHRIPSYAMFIFLGMVLLIGFRDTLPNVLFPCTDSTSSFCSVLLFYLY